jgi:cytochrome c oxidase assembly protein subunit 11
MKFDKIKNLKFYSFLFFLLLIILFYYFFISQFQKEKNLVIEPISINLLTSVHPNLHWSFKPVKQKIIIKPGDVTTIEYVVENLGDINTTGIATFAYFPKEFGNYVSKINCFCYDAQTLKPNQKDKFTLVLLIDPEVTKDSKTKDIKEATIQFIFFDYKEYKKLKKES